MEGRTRSEGFLKVSISEKSEICGGQALKVEGSAPSLDLLYKDLRECLRIEPLFYLLKYIDAEGEHIELVDQEDWETCLDELQQLSPEKCKQGLSLLIFDKASKQSTARVRASKTSTEVLEQKKEAAVTPTEQPKEIKMVEIEP